MAKAEFNQLLLDDLVAVALLDKAEGRVLLPDWQRILRGEVVAVGPGRMLPLGERAPMECSVGWRSPVRWRQSRNCSSWTSPPQA